MACEPCSHSHDLVFAGFAVCEEACLSECLVCDSAAFAFDVVECSLGVGCYVVRDCDHAVILVGRNFLRNIPFWVARGAPVCIMVSTANTGTEEAPNE